MPVNGRERLDVPPADELEEHDTAEETAEEYGVSVSLAQRWRSERGVYEPNRDLAGRTSTVGQYHARPDVSSVEEAREAKQREEGMA